jgi:ATP-binding cassette subfamily B protein
MRDNLRAGRLVMRSIYRADPVRAVGGMALAILTAVFALLGAVVLKVLTDAVVDGDRGGVVLAAVLMALNVGFTVFGNSASQTVGMALQERATLYFDSRMTELTAGIHTLEHHERPDYLDELHTLQHNHQQLAGLHNALVNNVATIVRLLLTIAVLARIHPLLFLLPLAGIPSVVASVRIERMRHAVQNTVAPHRRLVLRLFQIATTRDAAKEIRLFDLGDELVERSDVARQKVHDMEDGADWRAAVLNGLGWLVFGAGFVAAMALVAREAVAGRATPGDVVLALTLANSVNYGVTGLASATGWVLHNLKTGRRLLWLEDFAAEAAARAAPKTAAPVPVPTALREGICFEDVSFRYPQAEAAEPGKGDHVLEGVSLFVPAGSTVALVGDNGAGKTTLVKLLCRFYDPTEGRITVDGSDLRDLDVDAWRARLAGCFQDFARLELAAREAVGVGDLPFLEDDAAVAGALERAHAADVTLSLPDGLATQLGRSWDGGVEPSTGQWQKLALGRAMMREEPLLLVLDEPTASLDAATEAALFERYARAASETARRSGAITVLVSHRFSTVRMADLIVVVDAGRITEVGSHEELVARGGSYAELYGLQARAYR